MQSIINHIDNMNEFYFPFNILFPALAYMLPLVTMVVYAFGVYISFQKRNKKEILTRSCVAVLSMIVLLIICQVNMGTFCIRPKNPDSFNLGLVLLCLIPVSVYKGIMNLFTAVKTKEKDKARKATLYLIIICVAAVLLFFYLGPLYFLKTILKSP